MFSVGLMSCSYFTALSRGEDPSLRKPSDATDVPTKISVGLTAVQLKALHTQVLGSAATTMTTHDVHTHLLFTLSCLQLWHVHF